MEKRRGSSKSKSAKSKSKAEKEKLKKEEEERKAREEEEERLRLVEEEKERKRREKQERVEREKRERELAILRREEYSELREKLANIANELIAYQHKIKEAQEWDRYVRCDGTPDPTILGQINTYINLNTEEDTNIELKEALDKNHLTLALIDELFYKVRQASGANMVRNKQQIEQFHNTIIQLQALVSDYIDNATLTTLEKAVYMADKDSGNLQTVSKNDEVTVTLWANLAKNAKIRSFMFEEEGVGFEIPRTMATSDISLRFVLTKYDHHSYRATSSPAMRRRVKMPELPETEEPPQNTEVAEAPGTERQMSETERSTAAPDDPVMALLGGSAYENFELREKLANIANELITYQHKIKEAQEWDRYVRCDGTPDPTILGQINTYINLNTEEDTNIELKEALDKNHLTLALIDELLFYKVRQASGANMVRNKQQIEQFHNTIIQLQALVSDYIDNATLTTLEKAVYMADKDSGNLQTVSKNDEVTVTLWANLAKNAKIRSFMFEEEGVGFEIPRTMATSDISLRFVLTKYDHHSYRATSSPAMRRRVKMPELPETEEPPQNTEVAEAPGTERQMSETERSTAAPDDPVMALLGGSPAPNEQDEAALNSEEVNQDENGKEKAEGATDDKVAKDGETKWNKEEENAEKEDEDSNVPPVDPYARDETVINLHQWAPIYGVLYIDLLAVPPQPITTNGWIMKQVVGKKLQKIDVKEYSEQENTHIQASATAVGAGSMLSPDMTSAAGISETNMGANDGQSVPPPVQNEGEASTVGGVGAGNESATVGSVSQAAFAGQNGTASKQHAVAAKENTNVKILFKLPSSVCVPEMEIQVGRWNEEKKCWKIDGISDVAYDKEQNLLSWKTSVFGAFCCFQDAYVNMPLQQWEMRPKGQGPNNLIITIISTVAEIELEIKDDKCRLNFHPEREQMVKELAPLCGEWIEPLEVVDRLSSIGINIFPQTYSHEYVSICEKDLESERFVYQQMALVASGVSFAWSRFNAEEILTQDQIVIQAHDEMQPLNESGEEDWCLLLLGREQMYRLAIDEFAETFSTDVAQGQQVHFDMIHLVKPWLSEKSMEKVEQSSPVFIDTVYQMLMATKLITFS